MAEITSKEPEVKSKKFYSLTNKENRKYFLKVGREEIVFNAKETKSKFEQRFIEHSDFTENKKKYFIIKDEAVRG